MHQLTFGIVHVATNIVSGQVCVGGILTFTNGVDKGGRHKSWNGGRPVLFQSSSRLPGTQKDREGGTIHGGVSAWTKDVGASRCLFGRPVEELVLLRLYDDVLKNSLKRNSLSEHTWGNLGGHRETTGVTYIPWWSTPPRRKVAERA